MDWVACQLLSEDVTDHKISCVAQGGHLQIGAPTGKWLLVVIYRGKHDPVSKNYLASLQQIIYELDELGVEVVAVSGDGRERAESFVRARPWFNSVVSMHRQQKTAVPMYVPSVI